MTYRTRRRTGYSDDFRSQHEADQEAARTEQEARVAENARLRAAYLKGLEDERQAKIDQHAAKRDAALEPEKATARRQWLYDHPDKTGADFEKHAWPLLKEQLLEAQAVEQAAVYVRQAGWSEERAIAAAQDIVNKLSGRF